MTLFPRDQREQILAEEAKKKREKEWNEVVTQQVSPEEFESVRNAMIQKFGGAINPTVEDVFKYMQARR